MARSARRPEARRPRRGLLARGALLAGGAIAANPAAVGIGTAFLVAFAFVSANALWYQPHRHAGAFLATRIVEDTGARQVDEGRETTIRIEREADVVPPPKPDPLVLKVQSALAELDLYGGTVDGLSGPRTRQAVEAYQRVAGLEPTGEIGPEVVERLGIGVERVPEAVATPSPRADSEVTTTASVATPDPVIVQIQAGLRAFGNDGIELDGIAGVKTKSAIREFQSLFGLPVNGEPDDVLLAKMKDVGLVN